jgi:diacylglycerol kinase
MLNKLLNSFKYAICGIIYVVKTQQNMKIHLLISLLVIIFSYIIKINQYEWIALIITISIVLMMETINTAIEKTIDLITEDYNINAKIAKDTAAGAVLIVAIMAIGVGCLIFIPKLLFLIK